jgi:hypothetical protein
MKPIILIFILLVNCNLSLADSKTLDRAKLYIPIYKNVILQYWAEMPLPYIPCAQVEKESDWIKTATLKTSRELGRGLSQITIAYNKDGSVRFNNYKYGYNALKSWNWRQDPYNVKYQLTFMVLMDKDNYQTVRKYMMNNQEGVKSMLVCYNAGYGRWLKRRTVAKSKHLPVDIWTGGLDKACSDSEKNTKLYDKDLCSTVNAYPNRIFEMSDKYKQFFDDK